MTFRIPRPNVIESDQGYAVEILGRTGLLYVEGETALWLNSEVLAGPAGLAIYASQSPSLDVLSAGNRRRVLENVRAAFRYRGFDIQIIEAGMPLDPQPPV